ncbi:hypothetical protein PAERUG_P64_East_of_England_6_01_14_05482 [Pseudomonas aeruginosa]|nr:hypothetical protein PAERUG_P40_Scotland_4_VIM_2_09_12_03348 [Pseudomonas aeruginosa]CRX24634.1 hypothetical protein PAERUG_P64_East_of_England_6_01_14_05482 [Pseudomonas aeruginosa]
MCIRDLFNLQHERRRLPGQGGSERPAVIGVAHDNGGEALFRQQNQMGAESSGGAGVLIVTDASFQRCGAARAEEPGQAHLAVEVQGIAGVLLAEHLLDGVFPEKLALLVAPVGEQHADEAAEVDRAAPQVVDREVAGGGGAGATAAAVALGALRLGQGVPGEAGASHLQRVQQVLPHVLLEVLSGVALDSRADQLVAKVGIGDLGSRRIAQPDAGYFRRQLAE